MTPRQHQIEGANWALKTVRDYGLVYLSWKERTGKTLTALLAVENSKATNCLIITKKKAIPGWEETLKQWNHPSTRFTVVNYESVHKMTDTYDFIILDEAHHAISGIGRPSKTWRAVKKHTIGKPIIYLSATPYAEHIGLIYHQLKLSDWSPFPQKNFFEWYRKYGIPNMIYTPYGMQDARNQYRTDEVFNEVKHLFNFKTRQDVGIKVEPKVNLVIVDAHPETKQMMKTWVKDRVITIGDIEILGDSDAKKRVVHYQMEGGTIKTENGALLMPYNEKIDYIKSHYEEGTFAIMAHFVAERLLLKVSFPGVRILSSDGDAEGIDLSHIKKLLVYSMSFKTSKHTQRVARQANHNRTEPIIVDILAMDSPGIGKAVYQTVAVKEQNFIKSSYERSIK